MSDRAGTFPALTVSLDDLAKTTIVAKLNIRPDGKDQGEPDHAAERGLDDFALGLIGCGSILATPPLF